MIADLVVLLAMPTFLTAMAAVVLLAFRFALRGSRRCAHRRADAW